VANNNNLTSGRFSEVPTEELKKIARKGGIKSGQSRNAGKKIKACINDLLKMKIDCKDLSFYSTFNPQQQRMTISEALAMALIYKGLTTGDTKVIEYIASLNEEGKTGSTYVELLRKVRGEEM